MVPRITPKSVWYFPFIVSPHIKCVERHYLEKQRLEVSSRANWHLTGSLFCKSASEHCETGKSNLNTFESNILYIIYINQIVDRRLGLGIN